ncbi:MAG: tetratricopeptide repeat protein [Planctomycetota bacterium]|nr:tetratricopeptide repeat protein [Planctomycetota bacterium]
MATVEEVYAQGEKFKDEGRLEEAVAKFQESLEVDESYALAHFALAVVYGKLGRHEDAVKHGERAVELDPHDPFSYTALSVTYQRAFAGTRDQRYIHQAEEAMARAHSMHPAH